MPITSPKRYDTKQSEDGDVFLGHYAPHPTPPALPAQGLMPDSETCIKIAKALREFDGEE